MNTENFTCAMNTFTGEHEIMYLRCVDASYYVYVIEEIEGRYGPQLLVVVDGMNTIYALPTIKAFSRLSINCFYKITYLGEILFDNGYSKHEYDIKQISEEIYLRDAKSNFDEDKFY